MFRDPELANSVISFGSGYLADPNIGVQGSRGAAAMPLLATIIAWGRNGIVDRIDRAMSIADQLAERLSKEKNISLWAMPKTWITVFRPLMCATEDFHRRLPEGLLSTCIINNESWLRSVAANPLADIEDFFPLFRKRFIVLLGFDFITIVYTPCPASVARRCLVLSGVYSCFFL
jgi:hypothetical protein